jgi:hypothetical protein
MKIKFLSGPCTGQIDHAPNSQEIQLLAKAGIIEIIPWKDFRERLAAEASPAAKPVVAWGIREASGSRYSQTRIVKTVGSDTYFLNAPTADTPPAIVARFNALVNIAKNQRTANDAERSRVEQGRQQEQLLSMNFRF